MNIIHACCAVLALLLQPGDPSGAWSGRLASRGIAGTVDLDLERNGSDWQGDGVFRSGPDEVRVPLADVSIDVSSDGSTIGFSVTIEGALLVFEGRVSGDTITGQFQVREGGQRVDEGEWSAARGTASVPGLDARAATLQAGEVPSLVAAVSAVLRARYVDAAKGDAMACAIEKESAAGAYDSIVDARELADRLGRDLYAIAGDRHLKLSFSEVPLAPETPAAPESAEDREALRSALRVENFGFRKVEILSGNIGLLELSRFDRADLSGEAAAMAMGFLQNCDALVIDLRTCGGGDPAMVAFLASWLFDGPATHVADMYRREDDVTVQWWTAPWVPHRRLAAAPVCVLTAARTFSAAEALAFHLQQLGRARVVGEHTGGGAHPSRRLRLSDRFAITVPTSRAFDPETKLDWEGVGVTPDIAVGSEDALHVAHEALLERLAATQTDPSRAREFRDILESMLPAR
jgi:hypothetical protein